VWDGGTFSEDAVVPLGSPRRTTGDLDATLPTGSGEAVDPGSVVPEIARFDVQVFVGRGMPMSGWLVVFVDSVRVQGGGIDVTVRPDEAVAHKTIGAGNYSVRDRDGREIVAIRLPHRCRGPALEQLRRLGLVTA
jgi:hypothetical protein